MSPAAVPVPHAPPAPEAPPRLTRAARERQGHDACREARYREIHALRKRGYGVCAICRHLRLHWATVRKYLDAPSCPHPAPRPNRRRAITPYLPYLRERWDAGERRPRVLWAEIRARLPRLVAARLGAAGRLTPRGVGSPRHNRRGAACGIPAGAPAGQAPLAAPGRRVARATGK